MRQARWLSARCRTPQIKWEFVKGPDGKPTGEAKLDFTGFDREGERYFNQRQAFSAFNFAPYLWARRVKDGKKGGIYLRFADAKGAVVERRGADGTVNPVFDRLVVSVFRQIAAHLAEKRLAGPCDLLRYRRTARV